MKSYNPIFDPIPSELAYYDGQKYHCYNSRCIAEHEHVQECGRLPHFNGMYTPILRCEGCGTLYFGVESHETEQQPVSPPHESQPTHQEEGIILPNLLTV